MSGKLIALDEQESRNQSILKDLEQTRQHASELEMEVENLKQELEMQKTGRIDFDQIQEEHVAECQQLNEKIKDLEVQNEALSGELNGAKASFSNLEERIENLSQDKEQLARDLQSTCQERDELKMKIGDLENESSNTEDLEATISSLQEKIKSDESDLETFEKEMQQLRPLIEQLKAENANLELRTQSLEQEVIEAASTAEEAIKQKEDASSELKILVEQTEALLAVKDSLESENLALKSQIENTGNGNDTTKESLDKALEEISQFRETERWMNSEIERLSAMESSYGAQMEELENRCNTAEMRATEYQTSLESAQLEAAEIRSNYSKLEETVSKLKAESEGGAEKAGSDYKLLLSEHEELKAKYNATASRLKELEYLTSSESTSSNKESEISQKDAQIASLQAELQAATDQVETERRRAAQLDEFANRQQHLLKTSSMGGKKEDDGGDMEAAALAGGSAFKPLVGLVRSLPAPFSNTPLTNAARHVDKAVVALDARPHWRAGLIIYLILVHIMLLI